MTGVELFIRFAYPGCERGFCGLSFPETLENLEIFVNLRRKSKGKIKEIKEILKTFTVAYGYCQLIAEANGIPDPLEKEVVEAYFVGNELLDKVKPEDFRRFLESFKKFRDFSKIPERIFEKLRPLHAFQVLILGGLNQRFPQTPAEKDQCRISWGEIKSVQREKLIIEYQPLIFKEKISLDKEQRLKEIDKGFCQEAKKGDWAFFHLDFAAIIATEEQIENAQKYLQIILNAVNMK